ncbi:MAG: hypothetical protein J4F28_02240 [Nitrosopumilaceae archaeon]|nr:hypothetical protein [Nitrosopumilaceae archaeon]
MPRRRKASRWAPPICPIRCPLCGERMWIDQIITQFDRPPKIYMVCSRKCPGRIRLVGELASMNPPLLSTGGTIHRRPRAEAREMIP